MRQRRQGPREEQLELELARRVVVGIVHLHDGVLEPEQNTRVDLERQVEVDRAIAGLFGMKVDFPHLAQRVGLDEVALVVDMESVVDSVGLQVGNEAGNVDHSHGVTLPFCCVHQCFDDPSFLR